MPFKQTQQRIEQFVTDHQLDAPPESRVLDLASEVGELAKEILHGTQYGWRPLVLGDEWAEEMGDALFALICLANSTGVDLHEALERALRKMEERLRQSGSAGRGGRESTQF